jgi:hypothetical protein
MILQYALRIGPLLARHLEATVGRTFDVPILPIDFEAVALPVWILPALLPAGGRVFQRRAKVSRQWL